MAKDPTPRADQLREQREARYGHLQAKAEGISAWTNPPPKPEPAQMGRPPEPKPARKLIAYAGKESKGIAPAEKKGPRTEAQKAKTAAKKARQRVKHKRRTELPPEKDKP